MQLLATLVHNGTEYFTANKLRHSINHGHITVLERFPSDFFQLLNAELKSDRKATIAAAKMGFKSEKEKVEKFFDCNYSALGLDADVTEDGKLGEREVVPCDERETCPHQCSFCKVPCNLTQREVQVAIAITKGKMDAEITADLFISQNTLRNHKNNIENKIGRFGKTAIAVWAKEIGLI